MRLLLCMPLSKSFLLMLLGAEKREKEVESSESSHRSLWLFDNGSGLSVTLSSDSFVT